MVYGGLVNKNIVAGLQALGINALGLTGADMNLMRSDKRPVGEVDYGFVGDVKEVNADLLASLIHQGIVPVLAPLTHDKQGHMLNTNADTIAGEAAKALAKHFEVTLMFCFEKKGVLKDENDDESVIPEIDRTAFEQYVEAGVIQGGMIPKLENSFQAIDAGVKQVIITPGSDILWGKVHVSFKVLLNLLLILCFATNLGFKMIISKIVSYICGVNSLSVFFKTNVGILYRSVFW